MPVQVLDPLRVYVTIEDDPVSLAALPTNVVHNFTQRVREETVIPLTGSRVKSAIQRVFMHGLGIDHVCDALHSVKTFESRKQHLPCVRLSASRGTHHHQTVLNFLNLVELEDLVDPPLALNEAALGADLANLLS